MPTKTIEPVIDREPPTQAATQEFQRTATAKEVASKRRPPSDAAVESPDAPPRSVWREYFESAVVTIIMALFGITFIVQAVKVPTGSMQNTINIGDQLLVNKFIFAPGPILPFLPQREIQHGDIIVFKYPGNPIDPSRDSDPNNIPFKTNYVKRVIGLPNDRIEFRGRDIYINGELLKERKVFVKDRTTEGALQPSNRPAVGEGDYTVYYQDPTLIRDNQEDDTEELALIRNFTFLDGRKIINVPPGNYFAMGDNRDNSADGRDWGFVPRDLIIGRAMFVYWSYDMGAPSHGFPSDFINNSRWSRTGTLVK